MKSRDLKAYSHNLETCTHSLGCITLEITQTNKIIFKTITRDAQTDICELANYFNNQHLTIGRMVIVLMDLFYNDYANNDYIDYMQTFITKFRGLFSHEKFFIEFITELQLLESKENAR